MITKTQIKKTAKIAGLLACGYLLAQGITREFFPERIKNTEDLVRIVKQEEQLIRRDKLSRTIYWTYGSTEWGTAGSGKIGEEKYIVILDREGRNRTTVRHELYHIYAGHCDRAVEKGDWRGLDVLKDEITAMLYANYGWRF